MKSKILIATVLLLAGVSLAFTLYGDRLARRALDAAGLGNVTYAGTRIAGVFPPAVAVEGLRVAGDPVITAEVAELGPGRHVSVEGLDVDMGTARIEGVAADVPLDSLSPPTFTRRIVRVRRVLAALTLEDGKLEASLARDGRITIHASSWRLAGGTLESGPVSVLPPDYSAALTFTAKNVDLAELMRLAPVDGLALTGRVNGKIPFRIDAEGQASVRGAVLESTGPGTLGYAPATPPAFLDGVGQIDLKAVLASFEYSKLKMTLNGEAGKTQRIALRVEGRNPAFENGRPVIINFTVEGPLQSVIQTTMDPAGLK